MSTRTIRTAVQACVYEKSEKSVRQVIAFPGLLLISTYYSSTLHGLLFNSRGNSLDFLWFDGRGRKGKEMNDFPLFD